MSLWTLVFFPPIQHIDTFLKYKSLKGKKTPIAVIIPSGCNPKQDMWEIEMQVNFYKIPSDMTVGGLSDYLSSFEFFILK